MVNCRVYKHFAADGARDPDAVGDGFKQKIDGPNRKRSGPSY